MGALATAVPPPAEAAVDFAPAEDLFDPAIDGIVKWKTGDHCPPKYGNYPARV
jgi:hypothetical protein